MSFGKQVESFADGSMKKAFAVRKGILYSLLGDIISDTPVGNPKNWRSGGAAPGYVGGRLRTNWQTTTDGYAAGVIGGIDVNKPMAQVASVVRDNWDTVYFTNNLPYAARVEFTGWSWKQAPQGMVRKNILKAQQRGIIL